jgi:hypothetical protein
VSEDKESSGDSLVDAKRMALKLEMPSDWAFFDRTDFRAWDILVGLQRCLLGLHPKFRLNVEHPDEGVTFAPLAKLKRHQLATNIAQAIDVAVARGAKLEAEVQAACDEFGLSRREVFRFLKETRERRKEWPQMAELDGYECPWPTPNGYMIDESGRIVPSPATT